MRLLLAGQALSMFGDAAMWLALAIWAKTLTGSNAAAGLVFFVLALGRLISPFTGLVVDRVRRRPLLVLVNAAMACVVLLLLLVHDRGQVWLIYLVAFVYGGAAGILGAGRSALLKTMLPDDLLADANGAFATVREGLRLISPLVGAGLFAVAGGGAVAIVDAATFLGAAASLAALKVVEAPPERYEHRLRTEFLAGMRHVATTVALRQIVLGVAVALLVIGFAETVIFAVIDEGLHRAPSFIGVLEVFQGVGAIAGGLTAAPTLRRLGDGWLAGAGLALFALGDGLFVFSSLPLVLIGFSVAGVGIAWATVGFVTAVQVRSPLHLQGRVMSAADMMITIPQSISIALGAALSTVVDYRVLVIVISAVTGLCAAYLLTRRGFARPVGAAVTAGS
jgi:MFS family permease